MSIISIMDTKQLTRGAMVCAIYGALLLINQQTAFTIEATFSWIFAFPMLIYAATASTQMSLLVAFAMGLMSFLFGSFTTWFYSWSSIIMGLIYGIGIEKKWKNITNFINCSITSLFSTALMIVVWASIFDMELSQDYEMVRQFMPGVRFEVFVVLFIVFMGLLQALCIHLLALMVCIRMKIEIRPLQSVSKMQSPTWFGALSLLIWFIYLFGQNMIECSQSMRDFFQILWFLDCFVLDYFGVIFLLDACRRHKQRKLTFFVVFGAFVPIVNYIWMLLGQLDCLLQLRQTINEMEIDHETV